MSRRLLTTGLIVAALLAGRVTAKPPDLPLPQNDVLAPLTRPAPTEATPYVFPQAAEPATEAPLFFRMRPSVRRTMASCLLFAAHPLLALAPTAEYVDFDEEDVKQGTIQALFVSPAVAEPSTDGRLVGTGVNSDAGLTGSISVDSTPSVCPWMRQQQQCGSERHGVVSAEIDLSNDVLHNLEMLRAVQTLLQDARELGSAGQVCEAMDCLELAHDLCPGSWLDRRIEEATAEVFASVYCDSPQADGAAEEQSEPPAPSTNQEKQEKAADLLKQFNSAMTEGKYQEAQSYAEMARELDPDNPSAGAAVSIAERAQKQSARHDGIEDEEACPRCEAPKRSSFVTEKASAIEQKLSQPASMYFDATPLGQVIDDIRAWQGINIYVDKPALDAQEVSLDQPITIKLEDVSLKSALHLILESVHLNYVLKDEVLEITTERVAPCQQIQYQVEQIRMRLEDDAPSVDALMQQCHAAMDAGQTRKAAELARQAVAVDPEAAAADPLVYKMQLIGDAPAPQSDSVSLRPCLPSVDPGTPAALDQLYPEISRPLLGAAGGAEEQDPPADVLKSVAKPIQKTGDLEKAGCGKDGGTPISCLEVLKEFAAIAPPNHGELYLGLDGSVRMFTQLRRGGAVWHVLYNNGSLSVWASPDGGADAPAETPPDKHSAD